MTQTLSLSSLPLFPLQSVLYPQGLLALRVFEVRYLDMVRKCRLADAPFGVVALTQGTEVRQAGAAQEQFAMVGTLARIEHLDTPQPGLITLQCQGTQRFEVLRTHRLPHGLWVADVQMVDADLAVAVPDDLRGTSTALAQVLGQLAQRNHTVVGAPAAVEPTAAQLDDCGWVANRWCELLPVPLALKQKLMELENPLVRLELVSDVLDKTGIAH